MRLISMSCMQSRLKPVDINPVYENLCSVAYCENRCIFPPHYRLFCVLQKNRVVIFDVVTYSWNNHRVNVRHWELLHLLFFFFQVKFHFHLLTSQGLFTRQPPTHTTRAVQHMPFRCNLALDSRSRSQSVRKLVFLFLCHTDRVRDE